MNGPHDEFKAHRLIRASAGSGKTYQLTRHYLDLLRRGAAPQTILATTFTRKAAGEILGRMVRTLAEEAAREPTTTTPSLAKPPGAGVKPARQLLDELSRSLHRVGISTIDSFFHKLGNSFRLELDLPLEPRMIDEGGPEARQLRGEAIEAVLAEASADDVAFRGLLDLLRRLHHDGVKRSVTAAIDGIVVGHAEVFREAPEEATWNALEVTGLLDDRQLIAAKRQWFDMESLLPRSKKGEPNQNWFKAWGKACEHIGGGDWDKLVDTGIIAKVFAGEDKYYTPIPSDWLEACEPWCGHVRGVLLQRVARQTTATHELMRRFTIQYDQLRAQRGVMLYSDMAHRLAGGAFAGRDVRNEEVLTEIYFRLDGVVTHLLLDEFQDTGLDQWSVLSPFVEEITATADGSRSLFVVGDTKQAIYGWRGGCVELFDVIERDMPEEGLESLAKSWRSSQVVLDAVNAVFSQVAGGATMNKDEDDAAATRRWAEGYETHASAKPGLTGYVCFEASPPEEEAAGLPGDDDAADPGDPDDDAAPANAHERHVAGRIRELFDAMRQHGGGTRRTIGVLVKRNATVNKLLYELRRVGLPASGEAGNPLSDHPAVAAVLSALVMADHPGDTASAFHTLNSPLGPLLDMQRLGDAPGVARRIRGELLHAGYADTLARWVEALAPQCDAAGLSKLTKLVELAEGYDTSGAGGGAGGGSGGEVLRPGRFVDFAEGTSVEEPSPSPIRVMTIHRSKGLEFDAVVLPELDVAMRNDFAYLTDRPDPTGAIEAVYRGVKEVARAASPQLREAYSQRRRRQRQEDLCGLYVAMTRAKRGLYLWVKPAVKPDGTRRKVGLSYAGILRDTLGDPDEGCAWGDAAWYVEPADPQAVVGRASRLPSGPRPESSVTQPHREVSVSDRTAGGTPAPPGTTAGGTPAPPGTTAGGTPAPPGNIDILRVALPGGHTPARLRPRVTPSDHRYGPRQTGASLLHFDGGAARRRGLSFHEALETVEYLEADHATWPEALRDIRDSAALRAALMPRYVGKVTSDLQSQGVTMHHEEVWRERPFAVMDAGRLLEGRFDRVAVARDAQGRPVAAHVVDFKSDRVEADSKRLAERVAMYRAQVAVYRRALVRLLGIDEQRVTAELVFTDAGLSVAV